MISRNIFLILVITCLQAPVVCAQHTALSLRDSLALLKEIYKVSLEKDVEKSVSIAAKSLLIAQKLKDPHAVAEARYNMGQGYYYMGNYGEALKQYKIARQQFLALANKAMLARVHNAMGNACTELQDYPSSLLYYRSALALAGADSVYASKICNNIGSINIYIEQFDSAAYYFEQMLILSKNDTRQKWHYLHNMAYINYLRGYDARAIHFYRQVIAMAEQMHESNMLPRPYKNMADCYLRAGSYDSCLKYVSKSLALAKAMNLHAQQVETLLCFSSYYDSVGNIRQALAKAVEAEQVAARITAIRSDQVYAQLSALHAKDGNLKKALWYEQRHTAYLDSVRRARQKHQMLEHDALAAARFTGETTIVGKALKPWPWVAGGAFLLLVTLFLVYTNTKKHQVAAISNEVSEVPMLEEGRYLKGQYQGGDTLLALDSICWFEKKERAYYACTADTQYRIKPTLAELEAVLPPAFIRVNRAVIINLSCLLNYSPWQHNKYIVRLKKPQGMEFIATRDRIKKIEELLMKTPA